MGGNRSTVLEFKPALDKLNTFLNDLPSPTPNIILGGDFNLPHILWSSNTMNSAAPKDEKDIFNSLSKFLDEHFLHQHINKSTHIAGNILDLVFTNNINLLHSFECLQIPRSVSDHHIVECYTQFKSGASQTEEEKPEHLSPLDKLNFFSEDIDWDELTGELASHNWSTEFDGLHPNEMLANFMQVVLESCNKYIPVRKTVSKSNRTRIPRERRRLMRKRRKLIIKQSKNSSPGNQAEIGRKLIKIEMLLQRSYKASSQLEEHKATTAIKTNPKYFFAYAKKYSKLNSKIGPLLNEKNEYTSSSKEMANLLKKQYETVFSEPLPNSVYADQASSAEEWLTDIDFNEDDIIKAINEISTTSSSGPDGITAIYLKQCKTEISKPLYIIWRKALDLGITPITLLIAYIIPIHKGDHRGVLANYRPIALTSHLVKTFEKIIRNKIVSYLDTNDLFNPSQHGFRQGRSCLRQLLAHYDAILSLLEKGLNVDTVYLDLAKAFDKVDHKVILAKLALLGIGGKLLKWIESFLTYRSQYVLVNRFLSEPSEVKSGVPQGSVIGPLLFLVLISDIDAELGTSFLSSFADDTRVSRGIESVRDASLLQEDLDAIYKWADLNNMKFNDKKLEVLRYGCNDTLKSLTSYNSPDGTSIAVKSTVRDLGVEMSDSGAFTDQINKICEKAKDMCSWILRTFKSRTPLVMKTLWKSLVLPILDYCSQLWCPINPGHIQKLEAIQQSFTRKIKLGEKFDYWDRLSHLRMYSLQRHRERYRIIYIWKILEGLVPNISHGGNGGIKKLHTVRNGRTSSIPTLHRAATTKVQKLREGSLHYHGSQLFNALPKGIRDLSNCSVEVFKHKLDAFLNVIDDKPLVRGYTAARRTESNSLIHMIPLFRTESRENPPLSQSAPALRQ